MKSFAGGAVDAGRIRSLFGERGPEMILPLRRRSETEETVMAPVSVGRIVLVRLRDAGRPVLYNNVDEHPAIVTAVHGGGLINARVFVDGQATLWRTSVPHAEADRVHAPGDTWRWPPRTGGESR